MRSCGPVCGMAFTVFDTSTTVSPLSTPSLKSSKYRSFTLPPLRRPYSPRRARRLELEDEVPQRHVADVGHAVDDLLAEAPHPRRVRRVGLRVVDCPGQRTP